MLNSPKKRIEYKLNPEIKFRATASGLHIFNRVNGLNILFDELRLLPSEWSTAPRQVSIALTNKCDLKCPYCYAPKNSAILNFDKLTEWLSELDENGCIGIGFGGGEPTLFPKLVQLFEFAESNTRLAVSLTTHGHRLTDELLEKLDGNIHFIRISMDGFRETYESLRNRSFDRLINRMQAISNITKFGVNYVVNKKTINDLNEASKLIEDLGASEFLILPEEPIGKGVGIDNNTMLKLKKWIYEYEGNVPLTISEGRSMGLPTSNPFSNEENLENFAHIDALGFIKVNSYDFKGIPIKEEGVMKALDKLKTKVEVEK